MYLIYSYIFWQFKCFLKIKKRKNSVAFITFTVLYNHHLNLVPKHFCCCIRNLWPASGHPLSPPLSSPWQPAMCVLSPWIYLFWDFTYMKSYNMWLSVSGFFHLAWRFQGSSASWYISDRHSSLWLSNIPLNRYTTFCLPLNLLLNIWVSTF